MWFAPGWARSNSLGLKAERRKPSGEKHSDIEDIPSLTGVFAHFRLREFNAILGKVQGARCLAMEIGDSEKNYKYRSRNP